jgi:hypothetical protein
VASGRFAMFWLSMSRIIMPHVLIRAKNVILFPSRQVEPDADAPIACRERLGGLLNYCHRKAV